MEHRCSTERHECNIKVLIHKNKKPVAFGRIKNGSANGLFIETDFNDIQPGQLLTLEMMSEKFDKNNAGQFSIKALIIHKSENGFGSEIDIPITEHADLLFTILKGEPTKQTDTNRYSPWKIGNM